MLGKLLIGGVTLATVGYGIKKYCEEESCSIFDAEDEDHKTSIESLPMNFHYYKVSLYESIISDFQTLVNELKNCPIKRVKSRIEFEPEEVVEDSKDAKKITKRMKKYTKLLNEADHLLRDTLDRLRSVIEVNPDYGAYTAEEQARVQSAHKLTNVIVLLCHEKIVSEIGIISKHSKKLLKSQREIVNSISNKQGNDE